jgi:hypothetical protein
MSETLFVKRGDLYIAVGRIDIMIVPGDPTPIVEPGVAQPVPARPQQQAPAPAGGELALDVVEFGLSKRTDGKYQLELYTHLANGQVGKYPSLRHVVDRDDMWAMIGHLLEPYVKQPSDLPIRAGVLWRAWYKLGRETGKTDTEGKPTRYRDLVRVELAFR